MITFFFVKIAPKSISNPYDLFPQVKMAIFCFVNKQIKSHDYFSNIKYQVF